MIVMGLIGSLMHSNSRIVVLETQYQDVTSRIVRLLEIQSAIDARQDADIVNLRAQGREDFRQISNKLDSLLLRDVGH